MINGRVCSLKLELQGIHNEGDFVHQSTKKMSKLDQTIIDQVFHSGGLLLCVDGNSNLVVWNPYLGKTRCIPPARLREVISDYMTCLVSDTTKNNRNHKILRFFYDKDHPIFYFELFDFKTSSLRFLDIEPNFDLDFC